MYKKKQNKRIKLWKKVIQKQIHSQSIETFLYTTNVTNIMETMLVVTREFARPKHHPLAIALYLVYFTFTTQKHKKKVENPNTFF